MKHLWTGLLAAAAAVTATIAGAQGMGSTAYPDNWNGGPPLPAIGASPTKYSVYPEPYVAQPTATYTTYGNRYYVQTEPGYREVVIWTDPYVVPAHPVYLHPQTALSRARAHAYRFGTAGPVTIYVSP